MPDNKGMSRAKRGSLQRPYCEVCGYERFTTKHRILPRKRGGVYAEGNVISLCANCHWEADHEWIPADLLQAIVDARLERERLSGEPETVFEDSELARRARRAAEAWGYNAPASSSSRSNR